MPYRLLLHFYVSVTLQSASMVFGFVPWPLSQPGTIKLFLPLTGYIKAELASQDLPTSLDDLITLSCIDIRFTKRQHEYERQLESEQTHRTQGLTLTFNTLFQLSSSSPREEPMLVARLKLSTEE